MANITSAFGWVIVGLFVLIGLIVGWKSGGFLVGVFGGAVFGIVVGIPFIVAGQMASVFMDQKGFAEGDYECFKEIGIGCRIIQPME